MPYPLQRIPFQIKKTISYVIIGNCSSFYKSLNWNLVCGRLTLNPGELS